jgi:hypothetical protein
LFTETLGAGNYESISPYSESEKHNKKVIIFPSADIFGTKIDAADQGDWLSVNNPFLNIPYI